MGKFPELIVDLKKLENNIMQIKNRCNDYGVSIAGVIKGCTGFVEVAKKFDEVGVSFIASSRMEQLELLKESGIKSPLMLIRIPMLSEVDEVVSKIDVSLNSEISVLKALNESAKKQGKTHGVILMKDLGDLREGFYEDKDILEAALLVENELSNLHLLGIGTNLGCYGAVAATSEKLSELVACAEMIEDKIGRR